MQPVVVALLNGAFNTQAEERRWSSLEDCHNVATGGGVGVGEDFYILQNDRLCIFHSFEVVAELLPQLLPFFFFAGLYLSNGLSALSYAQSSTGNETSSLIDLD